VTRAALAAALCLLAGCASPPQGSRCGAGPEPAWQRAGEAARRSIADPHVWLPLAGAAALQLDGDWDRDASDWARERTPLFGSQDRAERWSDDLRNAASGAWLASMAAADPGDSAQWAANKARGIVVDVAAVAATSLTTGTMKSGANRGRPNGQDERSFPSGHASSAAVYSALASRNLEYAPLSSGIRVTLDAGLDALSVGTAWARVEAGWHYPSDVLFGMALGRFLGTWLSDLLVPTAPAAPQWSVQVYPLLESRR
jgi:hypothetical protein